MCLCARKMYVGYNAPPWLSPAATAGSLTRSTTTAADCDTTAFDRRRGGPSGGVHSARIGVKYFTRRGPRRGSLVLRLLCVPTLCTSGCGASVALASSRSSTRLCTATAGATPCRHCWRCRIARRSGARRRTSTTELACITVHTLAGLAGGLGASAAAQSPPPPHLLSRLHYHIAVVQRRRMNRQDLCKYDHQAWRPRQPA